MKEALADYDAALKINANYAEALYGRGQVKMAAGDKIGGDADIAAAKAINPKIAEEFGNYGLR